MDIAARKTLSEKRLIKTDKRQNSIRKMVKLCKTFSNPVRKWTGRLRQRGELI